MGRVAEEINHQLTLEKDVVLLMGCLLDAAKDWARIMMLDVLLASDASSASIAWICLGGRLLSGQTREAWPI